MKIESLIKRVGGSIIDMDAPKRQYHFKPEDGQPHEAPHVAIVTDASHAAMLLRIREGFRLADGEQAPETEAGDADGFLPKGAALTGSSVHNASYPIAGDETILLGELVVMAFQDSGLSYEQWEDLADQERYEYIDATLRELQAGEADPDEVADEQTPQPVVEQEKTTEPPQVTEKPANEQKEQQQEQATTSEEKPSTGLEGKSWEELKALYKARFGRTTRLSKAEIVAALSEDDD